MENLLTLDNVVLSVCALVGSLKASAEFGKSKQCFARGVDIVIGVIVGLSAVHHFGSSLSLGLSAMVGLIGGASGAMVIEVAMQVVPSVSRTSLKAWLKKLIE